MICSKQESLNVKVMMEVLYGFYDSKQFFLGRTVISFWSVQTLAEIGDDTLLTICFLGQHSSDALMTCIYIQNKLFPSFRICRTGEDLKVLELVKGVVTIIGPDELLFCFGQLMEWSGDCCGVVWREIFLEFLVIRA
ncbi:hypothetical protein TNCT_25351 [Trichonephila clavata]|uniref:Uncharacterized protein n=1 Tax=Trichonephila clavata TaxID=2740835 RepID=A0A8X6L554_TRICU|nr:hypothetical protein TNCT_25351 [Trichonephila clavata]